MSESRGEMSVHAAATTEVGREGGRERESELAMQQSTSLELNLDRACKRVQEHATVLQTNQRDLASSHQSLQKHGLCGWRLGKSELAMLASGFNNRRLPSRLRSRNSIDRCILRPMHSVRSTQAFVMGVNGEDREARGESKRTRTAGPSRRTSLCCCPHREGDWRLCTSVVVASVPSLEAGEVRMKLRKH
jgi:hypothetical protein